ncbi:YtpR family tRNA-binding protein [Facklamia sp. P9177]|uniref:YtpR family tRNA-binding protein n=1 Tax=Facklamia sp. P9177 TaxID=3421945 RepID=UPI003D16686B
MKSLAFYNKEGIGDVLLLTNGITDEDHLSYERKGDVTIIRDRTNDQVMGINIHRLSKHFKVEGQGLVKLNKEQETLVKNLIKEAGFDLEVEIDREEKFVVGFVEECQAHEDSDHLNITQTRVSEDEVLQIVCGAANIAQGQKVLVAKSGAVMPSGAIIWPGELRGVPSRGMICSTRELGLEDIQNDPGIWVLPNHFEVGTSLAEVIQSY